MQKTWMLIILVALIISLIITFSFSPLFAATYAAQFTPKNYPQNFLAYFIQPNVFYILILITLYGLFLELTHPGLILPGITGFCACLFLIYASQFLSINYAGLWLILIGLVGMLLEALIFSYGIIGLVGIFAFILGSVMLFDTQSLHYHLAWPLILSMCTLSAGFFFMLLTLVLHSQKKTVVTGKEGLMNKIGVVITVNNNQILVRVLGEIWNARSNQKIHQGEKVKVIGLEGLTLLIQPIEKNHSVKSI